MKKLIIISALLICAAGYAAISDIPWDVKTANPRPKLLPLYRGETVRLLPRYLDSTESPMSLADVYAVRLRYRTSGLDTNTYYVVTGAVHSVTGGTVAITWTPDAELTASVYDYTIDATSTNGSLLRAFGTIRMIGTVDGTTTSTPAIVDNILDWADITEHRNPEAAPFLGPGDKLENDTRLDGHDQDIIDLTDLVGDGVQGVQDQLDGHVATQAVVDAAQDVRIDLALESANMGGDISGVSTSATVIATRGRQFPAEEDMPANMEAMVWDDVLGGMKWGSVDLTAIWEAINSLISTAVSQTYVDTEISRVEGLVDGNDHTLMLTESFAAADWLEIAAGVFQHNSGWMAYNATMLDGQITLQADVGYLVMGGMTQCVSRIVTSPTSANWSAQYAETDAGPWTGYDTVRDNIVSTNQFAVKFVNTSGSGLSLAQVDLYTWTSPERVAFTRDFAGLHLLVDTPAGDQLREAVNVQYVRTLAASNDISGTFATGFSVDKIKGGSVNPAARANGLGLLWYSSVSEHRYVDLATQFELDAAVGLLCTIASYNALQARVSTVEAGGVSISGDVTGSHLQTTTVARIKGKVIDTPTVDKSSPVFDIAQDKIVWMSILSSNVVYAAGTNDISNVPAQAAAFYRALYGGSPIMPIVLDQQILGWFGEDGLTLPHGTINLMESNLTANVQMYDGSAANPALRFLSDPTTGWYRAAANAWRFMAANNIVADFGVAGITMAAGKDVILQDGFRAASIDEIDDLAFAEVDPLSVQHSTTTQVWTHVGGSYNNEGVIATSDVSSNGFAAVTYDLATGNGMDVVVEMSDLNLTEWAPFAPFAYPGYVRVSLVETLPAFGGLDTTISNIAATAWTRPDLYSNVVDTAGQFVHVDTAVQDRQPVPLAQMQAAVAGVQPSTWAEHVATQDVNLGGKMLLMGNGWTVSDVSGLGVISYTDMAVSTNSLQIAANLVPAITATAGYSGLTIATLSIDGGTGTVGVATNGVTTTPILQWTASLSSIQWQNLTPISETYPSTNTAGHYEIVAELPSTSSGYFRAVQPDGTSRVDVQMPLYVQGNLIETGFLRDGTNLLWVIDGVTNRVIMETYP